MKKKILLLGLMVCAIGGMSLSVYAATRTQVGAQALSKVTGVSVNELMAQRIENNQTYGTMASNLDALDAFQTEKLALQKENIYNLVSTGELTNEEAQQMTEALEKRQALCDGTGNESCGGVSGITGNRICEEKATGLDNDACGVRGTGRGNRQGRGRNAESCITE